MSVKSSIVKCLSNTVVKVPRNCSRRTLKIVQIDFQNDTFEKKPIIATEVVLIQLLSYNVSKQKIKMKTRNTMAPSYHSKVTSTQKTLLYSRESHFSLVWVMEFSIISSCLGKVKVFPITLT